MYRIHQIKLSLDESKSDIPNKIIKKIGNKELTIAEFHVVKESIDARDKGDIKMVYTVDFQVEPRQQLNIEEAPDMNYVDVTSGMEELKHLPVIVGFGPCGMAAGLLLARRGYKPLIIERGGDVDQRVKDVEGFWNNGVLNTESNVQFGEGGAGTFSDGKLTTGIKDPRIRKVLEDFVKAGADEDILYKQKPHIGTDVLRDVVKNIRKEIIDCGGEVRFNTRFVEVNTEQDTVKSITVADKDGEHQILTENVVMAIGHSARDTFRYLHQRGIKMEQKPFSIGVRIEHPQELIDRSQYGKAAGLGAPGKAAGLGAAGLPPADYKLSHRCANGRGVYTFCMCPGGKVIIASSQEGKVVTNGMSNRARNSGTANSGLLVDVRTEDFHSQHPLAGVEFQEKYEGLAYINGGGNYRPPTTEWKEFRDGTEAAAQVIKSLPDFAVDAIREAMPSFGRKIRGFDGDNVLMTGVETRSSSPVRFARNEGMEGTFSGFYPAGEGTGYAGGIMSAACDGIKVAEKIIGKYKAIDETK